MVGSLSLGRNSILFSVDKAERLGKRPVTLEIINVEAAG
jgi:hypothetical protein